jgi:hypothetical protein
MVTWQRLVSEKRLEERPASAEEIAELRAVVRRELSDAATPGLSTHGRFGHAYGAARLATTIAVRCSGCRVLARAGAH